MGETTTKWHYLDKNPNDLPKSNGWYIICHGTEWTDGKLTHNNTKNYDSEIRMCEFFDGKWKMGMVIAWCEKPPHPYDKAVNIVKQEINNGFE